MSRRTLGILAVVGSAIGAWWWTTQRGSSPVIPRISAREHGTVIFDNHTTASDGVQGVI